MLFRLLIYIGYYGLNLIFCRDPLAILLTAPTMALVLVDVATNKAKYVTIDDAFSFVMFIFFVISPLQIISDGIINPEGGPTRFFRYSQSTMVVGALCPFLFYGPFLYFSWKKRRQPGAPQFYVSTLLSSSLLTIVAMLAFGALVLVNGSIMNLLAPRYDREMSDTTVFTPIFLALLTTCLFSLVSHARRQMGFHIFLSLVVFGLVVVAVNPFNASRFGLIATYVPLFFIVARGRITAPFFYSGAMFAMLVLMPILNLTTRFGSFDEASARNASFIGGSFLELPFIDVFDLVVAGVDYTNKHDLTFGAKLLGDILFFVPRSIWLDKPTLHGLDVGNVIFEASSYGTANLSMPVFGDSFRDFWLFGPPLCGALVGWLINRYIRQNVKLLNEQPILQYSLIASFPILIRGPISAVIMLFLFTCIWYGLICRLQKRVAPPRSFEISGPHANAVPGLIMNSPLDRAS